MKSLLISLIQSYGLFTIVGIFFLRGLLIGKVIPFTIVIPSYLFIVGSTSLTDIALLSVFTAFGTTIGQIVLYYESRKRGYEILRSVSFIDEESKVISKGISLFESRRGESVIIGNLFTSVQGVMAIPAGINRMNIPVFITETYVSIYVSHVMSSVIIVKGIEFIFL